MKATDGSETSNIVALIPAAGRASRMGRLACSKEILPIGSIALPGNAGTRPRAVCEHLLESLGQGGIERGYLVLRREKLDIVEHLESIDAPIPDLAYLMIENSPSVPHTLDRAFPFVAGHRVALGFPDIVFEPADAFEHLISRQVSTGADIVLGLFPTEQDARSDMVELDRAARVRRIHVKQPDTGLAFTWSIALWTPRFTHFMHQALLGGKQAGALRTLQANRELFLGDVVQAGLDAGLSVEAVTFSEGKTFDIGTPESWRQVRRTATISLPLLGKS